MPGNRTKAYCGALLLVDQYFFSIEGLDSPLVDEEGEILADDATAISHAHLTARELARNYSSDFQGLRVVVRNKDGRIIGAAELYPVN